MIKKFRAEKANALVEFALILPLLVFFVLGVADLGHGFVTYISLANGAREGARWLTTHPRTEDPMGDAIARVQAAVTGVNIAPNQVTITPEGTAYAAGDQVTVAVDYSYPLLFGAIQSGIGIWQDAPISVPMHVEVTMTVLY